MVTILPDNIIEKLTCSECNGFLTVQPTKVYKDKVKCGRCSNSNDLGAVSLLNTVLQKALVPCQNKFEGCTKLLAYGEVRAHEEICPKGCYSCPESTCKNFKGSAYQLLKHFQSRHEHKILQGNILYIKQNQCDTQVFLYKNDNFLFLISITYAIQLNQVTVEAAYIGSEERARKMQQYFKIRNLENDSIITSKKINCTSIQNIIQNSNVVITLPWDEVSIMLCEFCVEDYEIPVIRWVEEGQKVKRRKALSHFDILESSFVAKNKRIFNLENYKLDQYSVSFSECRSMIIIQKGINKKIFDVCCSGCKQFPTGFFLKSGKFVLSNIILSCPCEKYIICLTCFKNAGFIWCRKGHTFTEQSDLGQIILDLQVSCQWNCNLFFNFSHLYEHEVNCISRPLGQKGTCPLLDCKEEVIKLDEHLKNNHNMRSYDYLNNRLFTLHFLERKNEKYIFNILSYFFIGETTFVNKNVCNIQFQPCDIDFPYIIVAIIVFVKNNKKRYEVCNANNISLNVLELEDFFLTCI